MTKQEFETLTGMTVDEATFVHAEHIYLNAGDLTKAEVCKEIKEHPWLLESKTVAEITDTARKLHRLAEKRLGDIEKLKAALLDACVLAADDTTWRGAEELFGRAACIKYKLENESDLNADDVAYIKENLA